MNASIDVAVAVVHSTQARQSLRRLVRDASPLTLEATVADVADQMLARENATLLCLPVVDAGIPIGTVSRHALNRVFLQRFGRELYGRLPATTLLSERLLAVDIDTPLEIAARDVGSRIEAPIQEDFVVTENGRYVGMGVVLDLLAAMQNRIQENSDQLLKAYQQLRDSRLQLVQSEKMAALGQMVAGIAHEINTPLGYVSSNVEVIRELFVEQIQQLAPHRELVAQMMAAEPDEGTISMLLDNLAQAEATIPPTETTAELLDDIGHGLDTIKNLVISLRNFSRLDQAPTASVDLRDCIEQTLTIARHLTKDRVEIVRRFGPVPPVTCAPSQINQVLLNLITNAVQAIDHGNGKVLLKTESDDRWVYVSVQDNGRGIPEAVLPKIFDPFFTTKPVDSGTGLGLSISHQIVRAHGGDLHVVSELGRGTRFVVQLPREASPT